MQLKMEILSDERVTRLAEMEEKALLIKIKMVSDKHEKHVEEVEEELANHYLQGVRDDLGF